MKDRICAVPIRWGGCTTSSARPDWGQWQSVASSSWVTGMLILWACLPSGRFRWRLVGPSSGCHATLPTWCQRRTSDLWSSCLGYDIINNEELCRGRHTHQFSPEARICIHQAHPLLPMGLWIQRHCTCTPSHSSCVAVILAFWACTSQGTYTSLTVLNSTFEALGREAFLSPNFSPELAGWMAPAAAEALWIAWAAFSKSTNSWTCPEPSVCLYAGSSGLLGGVCGREETLAFEWRLLAPWYWVWDGCQGQSLVKDVMTVERRWVGFA